MKHFSLARLLPLWADRPLRTKGIVVVSIPLGAMLFGFLSSYLVNREHDNASLWVERSLLVDLASVLRTRRSAGLMDV